VKKLICRRWTPIHADKSTIKLDPRPTIYGLQATENSENTEKSEIVWNWT